MNLNPQANRSITILTQYFQPSTGATAQLITDLSYALARQGCHTNILTSTPSTQEHSSILSISRCPRSKAGAVNVFIKSLDGVIFLVWSLLVLINRRRPQDVLLIVSNPPFIGVVGLVMRMLSRQDYIFVLQDLFPRSAQLAGILPARGPLSKVWSLLVQQVCKHSNTTIVLSHAMKARCLKEFNLSPDKVTVIHNWAVEKALPIPKSFNPIACDWNVTDTFTVQYSGNFGRLHEIITLLEAARILANERFHFLFVGDGSKKSQISAYINHYHLTNVTLHPYQDRSRLPYSLGACDVSAIGLIPGSEDTVAPSKFYGIISSAKPVLLLARHTTDIAKLITENQCGVVLDPGDPLGVAQTLRYLSSNPDILRVYSANASNLYTSCFGVDKSSSQYYDVITSTLNRHL